MTEFEFWLLALGIAAVVMLLERPLSERAERKRYAKEREKFQKEIDEGRTPEKCPVHISYNGALSVDPADLVRTAAFRKAISGE